MRGRPCGRRHSAIFPHYPGPVTDRHLAWHTGYDQGRSQAWQALWFAVENLAFKKFWFPRRLRPAVLRAFGAQVAEGVIIRYNVRVTWPWKLAIGQDSWIGEGVWLYNVEPITIGHDTCLSQEAFLCTGAHDRFAADFACDNAPIVVGSGSWIGARAVVLRGVRIGDDATVGGAALVTQDIPAGGVALAPAAQVKPAGGR